MYVGFSASTGVLASSHYVRGWSFSLGGGAAPALDLASLPSLPRIKSGRNRTSLILAVAFSAFVVLAGAGAYRYKNRDIIEPWELDYGPHRFKYAELRRATRGFRERELLGSGGFGKVYRGVLRGKSGETVAVKRVNHESRQGLREFVAEIASIGRLRHRNLVQLQGWCRRRGDLLLVYDYMPNGSLDRHLFGDHLKASRLTWPVRHRILRDVASALLYLHEGWESVVLHRDVKASNVLLDGAMVAHLGDFGLARLYDHGADLQTTHVVGTMGYIAPELARTGKASPLTDVYAFGTFLLEVTCGRRPVLVDTVHHGRKLLVDRVLECWHRGSLEETVDSRLQGNYNVDEARMVLMLGLMCSHPFPGERPTMRQVMQYLDGDTPLPELTPADMSLLSLMQNQTSFDQAALQYPWSGSSMGTMTTPDISCGR